MFTKDGSCIRGQGTILKPLDGRKNIEVWNYLYSSALTPEYFHKNYLQKSKPLLIKNSINDWPAMKYWTSDKYLLEKYGKESIEYEKLKDEKSGKLTHDMLNKNFAKFLHIYDDGGKSGYQYHMDTEIIRQDPYRNDYKIPNYIPCATGKHYH